ncbi:hypothetical protein PC120_g27257 [Phytophthora cactorum]|nr:hypothetical protein PC120_g27257 [Phytophthora cactorum]
MSSCSMPPALPGRGSMRMGSWRGSGAAAGSSWSSSSSLLSSASSQGQWLTAKARAVAAASDAPDATGSGSLPAALPGGATSQGGSWARLWGGGAGRGPWPAIGRAWRPGGGVWAAPGPAFGGAPRGSRDA